jgi:hypothetical protein
LTVVKEQAPGKFGVAATIETQRSARTMTLDPKTHRIYLSAATQAPAPASPEPAKGAPAAKGGGRRAMVPGSFVVLVVTE